MKKIHIIIFLLSAIHCSAQSPLIPYRAGKLWGLADTLGKIKVIPAYDTIYTPNNFAGYKRTPDRIQYYVVKKGQHYGLLRNTQILMQAKYHSIDMDSVFIREDRFNPKDPTIGGSHVLIYNLKAQLLIPDSLMEIQEVKHRGNDKHLLYTVRGRKNNSGLFWYDPKQQKIMQWLVTGAEMVGAGGGIDNTIGASVYMPGMRNPKELNIIFNEGTNLYDVSPVKASSVMGYQGHRDQRSRFIDNYHTTKNNFLLRNIEFFIKDGQLVQVRKDSRFTGRGTKIDTIHLKNPGDSISLSKFRRFNSVEWHSTIPYDNQPLLDKIDSGFQYVNYVTYKKNGKIGIIVENTVIPAEYQDLIYFKSGMIAKPFFIASKVSKSDGKTKWGVINSDNKIILPCIYDQIIRSEGGGSWILKKDNLYGLADYQGDLIYPSIYEKITPDKYNLSFTIFDKGKYGYFSSTGIRCAPIFPYPVNRWNTFADYNVFELSDNQGNILGYADHKGFLYFKN
jgi:hypothetical protein